MSIGINIALVSATNKPRHEHDFHKTPPEPVQSLIDFYAPVLVGKKFHDGSCGDGAITRVMTHNGLPVVATDLVERGHDDDLFGSPGFGQWGVDFLKFNATNYPVGEFSTIQNPPFNLWREFVYKCHELEMPFIAMFGKIQIWNAANRLQLWHDHPPKAIHPLTWRVDFSGQGRPTMDCCWCVWSDEIPFSNEPLERPEE